MKILKSAALAAAMTAAIAFTAVMTQGAAQAHAKATASGKTAPVQAASGKASSAKAPATMNASKLPTDVIDLPGGRKLEISFIKHASLALNYDGIVIYVDPVASFQPYSDFKPDYAALDKADFIFITHAHPDHLDPAVIKMLSKKGTQIILNKESQQQLGSGMAMANGDVSTLPGGALKVTAVPAYNTTPGNEKFHPKGRDNGYILEFPGYRIYISGDTEVVPDEVCNPKAPIDIAFFSVNQPYTMTLDQAATQARKLKPRILYPIHYGTTDINKLPGMLEGSGIDVRIRQMQ